MYAGRGAREPWSSAATAYNLVTLCRASEWGATTSAARRLMQLLVPAAWHVLVPASVRAAAHTRRTALGRSCPYCTSEGEKGLHGITKRAVPSVLSALVHTALLGPLQPASFVLRRKYAATRPSPQHTHFDCLSHDSLSQHKLLVRSFTNTLPIIAPLRHGLRGHLRNATQRTVDDATPHSHACEIQRMSTQPHSLRTRRCEWDA